MTPKVYIISAHAPGDIEGVCMSQILCHIPNRVSSVAEADVVMVCISWYSNYQFNPLLVGMTKPVVIVDFMEVYGAAPFESCSLVIGGGNFEEWLRLNAEHHCAVEWSKLHAWVSQCDLRGYFMRELYEEDVSEKLVPIEWPCVLPAWAIEPRQNFDTRPFEVFYCWGMSNPLRPSLHGQIYELMGDGLVDVIGHWDHIDAKINEPHRKWISIHSPHTHRVHLNEIARRQAQSKMSVSMPGAGQRCFRDTEAPVHTAPVYVQDGTARSYPWQHGVNCLKLDMSAHALNEATQRDDLHDIYVAAQETIDRYRTHRYTREYVMPHLKRFLS